VAPEPELDPESGLEGLEGLELAAGVGDAVAASTGPDSAKPPATAAAPSTGSASSQRLLIDTDGTSFALTRPIGVTSTSLRTVPVSALWGTYEFDWSAGPAPTANA